MRARLFGALVLVMSFSATQAFAQDAPGIAEGSRVRVEAATVSRKPVTGTILKLDQSSMTLLVHTQLPPMVVPRDAITKMEFSTGRRSKAKAGALIGAVALAITASLDDYSPCSGGSFCLELPPKEAVVAFAGVLGAGLGALVGLTIGTETWTPVPSGLRVSVAPKRKGGVLSLSFAF